MLFVALLATSAAPGAERQDTCRPGSVPAPGLTGKDPRCDVLIVSHAGGWGNAPLEHADDLRPVVLGIENHLQSLGLRTRVLSYNRLPCSPLPRVVITAEHCGLHSTCSRVCARRLERIMRRRPGLHVVMVGLSNGAAFANSVMAQLDDWAFDRTLSVECGRPVYYPPIVADRILAIVRQDEDFLASGPLDMVLSDLVGILVGAVVSGLIDDQLSFKAALHQPGHDYPWPEIAPEVTAFLDRWMDSRTASPASSRPGQE